MNVEQLETFVTVVNLKSYSKAAIYLHVSQPTVSSRIRILEEDLGQKLLQRQTGKKILLTPAGEYFYKKALEIIEVSEKTKRTIQEFSSESEFSIGSSLLVSRFLLKNIIPEIKDHPDYTPLNIRTVSQPHQLIDLFYKGMIDMAIMSALNHSKSKNIEILWNEPTVLIASPDHPATKKNLFLLRDLTKYPLVSLSTDINHYSHQLKKMCKEESIDLKPEISTDNFELTISLVKQGHYLSFVPLISVEEEIRKGELIKIPHKFPEKLSFNIYLLHRFEQENEFAKEIYNLLKEVAAKRKKQLEFVS